MLAATVNVTVPLPLPLAPDTTVVHVAPLVAVHAQLVPLVTVTVPPPPAAPIDWAVGLIVKVHGVGVGDGVGMGDGDAGGVGAGGGAGDAVGEGAGDAGGVGVGLGTRAACATTNVWPAIVKAPLLAPPLLDWTVNATRPEPIPVAPELIATQVAAGAAVHEQSLAVVTVTCPVAPSAPTDCDLGEISNGHGVPSCRTGTAWLLTKTSS